MVVSKDIQIPTFLDRSQKSHPKIAFYQGAKEYVGQLLRTAF